MLTTLAVLLLFQPAMEQPFARQPDISGDKVVYCCEGDLWLGEISNGKAVRLTRSEGTEYLPRFSPDGSQIAFTASYGGVQNVFVMSVDGGEPKRVTWSTQYPESLDWTPDGKNIVIRKYGSQCWRAMETYKIPLSGGMPERMPIEFASVVSMAPDGKRFVFNRYHRSMEPWFRYEGGLKNDIWVGDGSTFKKVYQSRFTNEYPVWAGDRLAWSHDEGGTFTVLTCKPDGSDVKRVAGPYDVQIRNIQTDGVNLIYEKGRGLERVNLKTGEIQPVVFQMVSDKLHMLPYNVRADALVVGSAIGPSGKRVMVETRGQIVSLPVGEGDARIVLAKPGVRYQSMSYSPDGKKMAYFSDETREQQLYIADNDGSHGRQLTTDSGRQLKRISWSPDGKRIALTDSVTRLRLIEIATGQDTEVARGTGWDGPGFDFTPDGKWMCIEKYSSLLGTSRLFLYDVENAKTIPLSDGKTSDWGPAFSQDGKWLGFLTKRAVYPHWDGALNQLDIDNPVVVCLIPLQKDTPSPLQPGNDEEGATPPTPVKPSTGIDLDGIYERQIETPIGRGDFSGIGFAGDRVLVQQGDVLQFFDIKAKRVGVLTNGVAAWATTFDGKKILIQNGNSIRVIDTSGEGIPASAGRVGFGGLMLQIDPPKEWGEMYWDAWRIIRDYFYVQNMHGNDWKAIGEKYAKFLPSVRSRDELNILIYWLLAELSVSHAGADGGDFNTLFNGQRPAFLGADFVSDPSGFLKITNILRGDGYRRRERSPLAEPGLNVKEGMFLIEVAGVPVKADGHWQDALLGRSGEVVAIKVNDKPSVEGARTIRIRPMGDEGRLRYLDWVKHEREYVLKASNGRIGYVHMASMVEPDMADFALQYFAQRDKDAIIIDDRFNGGGNISTTITNILKQTLSLWFNSRNNSEPTSRQGDYYGGPLACLLNEFSGSNGEEFPDHFRKLKLGPLVGMRTWGGEVGSAPGWPLADGGRVNVPNYGAWHPKDGWSIEGTGVSPDIEVESDPNLWVKGIEPQLDKAVQYLLGELAKHPRKPDVQPVDPVKVMKTKK